MTHDECIGSDCRSCVHWPISAAPLDACPAPISVREHRELLRERDEWKATAQAASRFWSRVAQGGGCWEWTGGLTGAGYGSFSVDGRNLYAHRYAYEALVPGGIPDQHELHHECENRKCVNPKHLTPVTVPEHREKAPHVGDAKRSITHCPQGHEYTPDNTYTRPSNGQRECRACKKASSRRVYLAKKEARRG